MLNDINIKKLTLLSSIFVDNNSDLILMNQRIYWETRFQNEGSIWTFNPCRSAFLAREKFQGLGPHSLLIPGSGYGRNAACFSDAGYAVTGIEISERAIEIAKEHRVPMTCIHGSLLDMPDGGAEYDAIFCFNVLHLFRAAERTRVVGNFERLLKNKGYGFVVVLSDLEEGCGKGEELEANTYMNATGKVVHYFSDRDLREHFGRFQILETGIVEEPESRGGKNLHPCRYIFFRKQIKAERNR